MYEKNRNNTKGNFKNRNARPRNVCMTFAMCEQMLATNLKEVDPQVVKDVLDDLNTKDIFKTVSIPVQISRALMTGDAEKKGNMNVGYIQNFDVIENCIDIVIYASSVDTIQKMADANALIFKPRILAKAGDDTNEFVTFLSFDLVAAD